MTVITSKNKHKRNSDIDTNFNRKYRENNREQLKSNQIWFITRNYLCLLFKGNCGVKMTVFQVLGFSTLFEFLTLSFAGGVFQVRKTTKTKDQNVNRKPPSWNRIACSESGQRLVA